TFLGGDARTIRFDENGVVKTYDIGQIVGVVFQNPSPAANVAPGPQEKAPFAPSSSAQTASAAAPQTFDASGIWVGERKQNGGPVSRSNTRLELSQNGPNVSGTERREVVGRPASYAVLRALVQIAICSCFCSGFS